MLFRFWQRWFTEQVHQWTLYFLPRVSQNIFLNNIYLCLFLTNHVHFQERLYTINKWPHLFTSVDPSPIIITLCVTFYTNIPLPQKSTTDDTAWLADLLGWFSSSPTNYLRICEIFRRQIIYICKHTHYIYIPFWVVWLVSLSFAPLFDWRGASKSFSDTFLRNVNIPLFRLIPLFSKCSIILAYGLHLNFFLQFACYWMRRSVKIMFHISLLLL